MGNSVLIGREAEMTHRQPHLGDTRCQEPDSHFVPLLCSVLLKKGTYKTLRALDPIKTSPIMVSTTTRKEAPTGNSPIGLNKLQAVTRQVEIG